jgi:glutamate-5-semialdehyde dehydrogenase
VTVSVQRSALLREQQAEPLPVGLLGIEWEWETARGEPGRSTTRRCHRPFNEYSPASYSPVGGPDEQQRFNAVDAPFVGDGFTRWVDGRSPSTVRSWAGQLAARPPVQAAASGDSVYTVRTCFQTDPDLHR